MYGASIETPRNRLVGARTVKSSRCRGDMTAFQLEASAHAPWTRTIVGLGMCLPYRPSDHEDTAKIAWLTPSVLNQQRPADATRRDELTPLTASQCDVQAPDRYHPVIEDQW